MNQNVSTIILRLIAVLWLPHQVRALCFQGCANCSHDRLVCYKCNEGYWLKWLSSDNSYCISCPDACETCTDDFTCQSCKPQFYGILGHQKTCQYACSSNCTVSGCADETGYCEGCPLNRYGPTCGEDCNLCRGGLCNLRKCLNGCTDGYVELTIDDYFSCRPCIKPNCMICSNTTFCTQCNDGYLATSYIHAYERGEADCTICSSPNTCGDCDSILNCKTCSRLNGTLECTLCDDGYVVEKTQCIKKDIKCPTSCKRCDNNGNCNNDCKEGYTGPQCSFNCPGLCRTCTIQDICDSCKGGTYTKFCNISCNTNCLGDTALCNINDGYCSNGCTAGFWGNQCQERCSGNCHNDNNSVKACYRNGTCIHGCSVGYSEPDCSKEVPTTTTITTTRKTTTSTTSNLQSTGNGNETSTSSLTTITTNSRSLDGKTLRNEQADSQLPVAAIGGGVGGCVVLVTVVVVVIICIVKRRKRSEKEDDLGIDVGRGEASNPVFDPEINNAELTHPTSAQPVDYIYAQPNKPKKQVVNTSSPEDPNAKTYSSVEIDMNDKDAGDETDTDETAELEDLDDGEADVIAAVEAEAPSTDTYYNTEGLKRSRIQVSKLLDYIRGKSDFHTEFERLPKKLTRSCNEALKPQNRAKNRYNGVYSYDATRVVLRSKEYINASHIEGYNNSKAYIASLGPTKSTMPEFAVFWEMVWQEKTQKIVMLTNLMESGKMKCDQYWPDNGSSRQYGSISVTAKAEHVYAEFVLRELQVIKAGESRTVTQYHYTAWPDKSVPDTVVSLVEFRDMVEKKRTSNAGPMVVHCSAGIGRTGTYIALDTLIKEGKAENSVDIFGCVNALRGQRVHMVQNVEQYVFLHHCVVYALTCQPGPLDVSSLTSYTGDDNINAQFQALKNLPPLANKESDSLAINTKRKENRKGSDIPGDHHRVKLMGTKKDYINAVFVDGYLQTDRYILAQTPMPSTLEDFLTLLYQEKIGLIVCLDEEDGKDKTIGQYIAPANKVSKIGQFTVSTVSCESSEAFVVRTLKFSKIGQSNANDLNIRHYHFQGWKNTNSVPESLQAFMSLITSVNKQCRPESGILLFHCLDGATKSGLLCAVTIMLETLAVEKELSVVNTVCQVRGRRRNALQEYDQFKFCYNCVREHLETSEAKAYYNIL